MKLFIDSLSSQIDEMTDSTVDELHQQLKPVQPGEKVVFELPMRLRKISALGEQRRREILQLSASALIASTRSAEESKALQEQAMVECKALRFLADLFWYEVALFAQEHGCTGSEAFGVRQNYMLVCTDDEGVAAKVQRLLGGEW